MECELDIGVTKREEIDTRAPFRSVKEAVSLFGEKVLAPHVYSNSKLNINNYKDQDEHQEVHNETSDPSKLGTVTAELEETKQSLQRAKEDSLMMEHSLSSLKEELERTKQELQQIKRQESRKIQPDDQLLQINAAQFDQVTIQTILSAAEHDHEFQRKRYVTFANPPSLAQVIVPQCGNDHVLERHPSLRMSTKNGNKKKKPLIPLIGGIFNFSRKKV